MQHNTLTLNRDGHDYHVDFWKPESTKAVLVLIHGHSEYSKRYQHVAEYLNQENIAVIAPDLFGHGKSAGKRGHVPSYDVYLDSVEEAIAFAKKEFPDLTPFVYGHSMGGNIVASLAMKRHPDVKGVILSAPWLRLAFEPSKFQLWLANTVKGILPSLTQPAKLDANGLSRDADVVKAYQDDPMVHGMISPTAFLGLTEHGEWLIHNNKDWSYPLLHFHGTDDPVTSMPASKEFFDNIDAEGKDLTFKAWEGYRHEAHNDVGKEEVLAHIASWINSRS
ncbi:MAG: lysophospholipase [Bacteroidota bacterium]